MAIQIGIHDPDNASLNVFHHEGKMQGSVVLRCGRMSATIYTTPDKARAIADIINDAGAAQDAPPVAAE